MHKRSRLIVLGVVTFVVGVVLFFPARVAYRWFAPEEIKVSGISGSVWQGSASEALVSGVYLRDLDWRIHPLSLISGKLSYAIESQLASGFLEGDIGVSIMGKIVGSDINAALPLQAMQSALGVPGLQGSLSAEISDLEIDNGLPVAMDGVVNVSRLIVPLVQRESLGGFKAEFMTQDSGIVASVEDTDAVVDIAGSLQVGSDRSYQFIAQLSPKENTPAPVREQMKFLGSANERGQHELRLEGQL
ncbi:MAG: type II secretion system protein N [Woeseiaceae bacterium]